MTRRKFSVVRHLTFDLLDQNHSDLIVLRRSSIVPNLVTQSPVYCLWTLACLDFPVRQDFFLVYALLIFVELDFTLLLLQLLRLQQAQTVTIRVTGNFDQSRRRGRPWKIFLSSSLLTMQYLFAVSHTVCAHVIGGDKKTRGRWRPILRMRGVGK